jgi:hypothetical protein
MLKKSSSCSRFASSLAAASLEGLFEHLVVLLFTVKHPSEQFAMVQDSFFNSLLGV